MAAANSIAQLTEYTKRVYGKMTDQLADQNIIYKAFKKEVDMKPVEGVVLYKAAEYSRHTGIGARPEGGQIPVPGRRKAKQYSITLKNLYATTSFTGQVFEQMDTDKAAFAKTVSHQIETLKKDWLKDFNRQIWGKGTGALCLTNGAGVGTATLVLKTPYFGSYPTQFLYEGQRIDIWTTESTGGSNSVVGVEILSVDSETQVTLVSTQTWADNSFVFLELNRNNEITGIQSMVDDGTFKDNYFGITRSTNRFWKSLVLKNGGTPRAITESLVLDALSKIGKEDGVNLLCTNFELFNALAKTQLSIKRYNLDMGGKVGAIPAGYDGLNISNKMLYADQDCPNGVLFGMNTKYMSLISTGEPKFMDKAGSIYQIATDNTDGYKVGMFWYGEAVCDRPNTQFVLGDLTV